jgi:hypothetical protein
MRRIEISDEGHPTDDRVASVAFRARDTFGVDSVVVPLLRTACDSLS